jgi:hypothetical protein
MTNNNQKQKIKKKESIMKTNNQFTNAVLFFVAATTLFATHATRVHASELLCDTSQYSDGSDAFGDLSGHQLLFKGTDVLSCTAVLANPTSHDADAAGLEEKAYVNITFPGVGLGLRATANEVANIFCPTISSEALGVESYTDKDGNPHDGITKLYGVKFTGGFILGGDVALAVGKDAAVCFVTGIQLMVEGASLDGIEMDLYRSNGGNDDQD